MSWGPTQGAAPLAMSALLAGPAAVCTIALLAMVALLAAPAAARTVLRNADGSCVMFPAGAPWHQDISAWPVYSLSSRVVSIIGSGTRFHADFSGGERRGGRMIY